jgi:dihydropteroate synthase
MGIVNVTPDSFSDGGRFMEADAAVEQGRRLAADGADILDVGGESTRPGAEPVDEAEELRRVLPVVERLAAEGHRVSIDTTKAGVARAAIAAGAEIVNDVSAGRFDPQLLPVAAEANATVCLMHMLGEPRTMQSEPRYDDVVAEVAGFLADRVTVAVGAGISDGRIWIDPGIGFGKTLEHNVTLLGRLDELVALDRPVVVGSSRKSFIGRLTGRTEDRRLGGTVASNLLARQRGAAVLRVHDVAEVVDALRVAEAIEGGRARTGR